MNQDVNTDTDRCPECGAATVDGLRCWKQLGMLLSWEAEDRELAGEHFLTVASYNLQHPAQFVDEVLAGLQASFIEHLDHGLPVEQIRRRTARATAGKTRVLKDESERHFVLRRWPMTIADVYLPDQPGGAAGRVRTWAATIRRAL